MKAYSFYMWTVASPLKARFHISMVEESHREWGSMSLYWETSGDGGLTNDI